jgi:hypothetical protein
LKRLSIGAAVRSTGFEPKCRENPRLCYGHLDEE